MVLKQAIMFYTRRVKFRGDGLLDILRNIKSCFDLGFGPYKLKIYVH
jgi:hypothetical protein